MRIVTEVVVVNGRRNAHLAPAQARSEAAQG
jgi:hypothetical protein